MYRAYYDENRSSIPEHYSGNAIQEGASEIAYVAPHVTEPKISPILKDDENITLDADTPLEDESAASEKAQTVGFFESAKKRLNPKELFRGKGGFSLSSLSFEDVLIVATAAMLILSKDGDLTLGLLLLGTLLIA